MITDHLDTEITLYDYAGRRQLTLKGMWTLGEAVEAAGAYLALLPDVEAVRIAETLPWGEEHATRVTRGLAGPAVEPELPYATN